MTRINVFEQQLREWCVIKFKQVGVEEHDARIASDVLVHANLRGVDSHGVLRMEHYITKLTHRGINPNPQLSVLQTGASTARVDGDDGLGHVVAERAMSTAIALAKESGIGAVSAVNSSHCGALSYFVEMAAQHDMIGIAMTNTDKMVVPFGGSEAYFGTNPIAFGFPAGDEPSVLLDMATSAVAYGKLLDSMHHGKQIPLDWAVDAAGQPTADPSLATALLPFGGPKGYGLGLVVDVFAGLLTGSPFGPYVPKMYGDDPGEQRKLGHFVCAIDIGRFTDTDAFVGNIQRMMKDLHQMQPAPGFERVMLPGEPEVLRKQERQKHGIPLTEELYRYLQS